jgi:2-oxoglutarate/2-oxoacid ferredoxin oxidoreductase subunit alpha
MGNSTSSGWSIWKTKPNLPEPSPDALSFDPVRLPVLHSLETVRLLRAWHYASSRSGKQLQEIHQATVRFAGDSGDGMQLVGSQFADLSSLMGNAIRTEPDFPSEIRAPAGSLAGVSGYQLHFADEEVTTPGDEPYVLVAMNPAALKVNLPDVRSGGVLIVNQDEFKEANLAKARYQTNPLEDGSLAGYRVVPVPMTRLNEEATRVAQLSSRERARCKNFFALGVVLWLYDRPLQPLLEWLMKKFRKTREVMAANGAALRAGYNFANTTELFRVHYHVAPAKLPRAATVASTATRPWPSG